jgi:hypothetical protein
MSIECALHDNPIITHPEGAGTIATCNSPGPGTFRYNAQVVIRRHLHLCIALLLPLMVMRSLLPVGFMPVADGGQIRMVLCSAGLQLPGSDHDSGDRPLPGSGGDCLFAHASTTAPPPVVFAAPAPVPAAVDVVAAASLPRTADTLLRAQSARGPPALIL